MERTLWCELGGPRSPSQKCSVGQYVEQVWAIDHLQLLDRVSTYLTLNSPCWSSVACRRRRRDIPHWEFVDYVPDPDPVY